MAVNILAARQLVPLRQIDQSNGEVLRHFDKDAVHSMADHLLSLVQIEDGQDDLMRGVRERTYSIAVGDLTDQKAFAQAVERRANEIATAKFDDACTNAIEAIRLWGVFNGWTEISKTDAIRIVTEACRKSK